VDRADDQVVGTGPLCINGHIPFVVADYQVAETIVRIGLGRSILNVDIYTTKDEVRTDHSINGRGTHVGAGHCVFQSLDAGL
jgi:hypothetical protein